MSTTEQTTKKNFTNYKVFGFWLAKCFKDQGIIDKDGHDAWIKAQEIHGSKEDQEEFYGKFYTFYDEILRRNNTMKLHSLHIAAGGSTSGLYI